MIRAFVVYEGEPDPARYEEHAELCRRVPGGTFRHGAVFGAPLGEPRFRYYAEWEFPDELRIAIATPLSHAAMSLVAPVLLSGGAFYVMDGFTPDGFFDLVEEHRITATLIVPVMLYALQGHPRYETADMSSMETIFYGASPMSPAVQNLPATAIPSLPRLCALPNSCNRLRASRSSRLRSRRLASTRTTGFRTACSPDCSPSVRWRWF